MTQSEIPQAFPLAALFIDSCGLEVTNERIESIFKQLDLNYLPKIASMFCLDKEKLDQYTSFVGASASSSAVVSSEKQEPEKVVEEKKVEKEEDDEDLELDDFFS